MRANPIKFLIQNPLLIYKIFVYQNFIKGFFFDNICCVFSNVLIMLNVSLNFLIVQAGFMVSLLILRAKGGLITALANNIEVKTEGKPCWGRSRKIDKIS